MKRLLVLGASGMLGHAVDGYFQSQKDYAVTSTYRNAVFLAGAGSIQFDALSSRFEALGTGYDYVLNCVGIVKPFMAEDPVAAVRINSLFPWELARWCNARGMRLIHITTDCVYSGLKGKYVESDPHDALDDYGKSKSLGECVTEAMVLRTSIIGEEIHKHASLVAWAKSQKGKTVGGFATHLWNGLSTREYAVICGKIIKNGWYEAGLYHVFAADDVSKLAMMRLFNKKYSLGLTVEEKNPPPVDRTLRSEKALCGKLDVPTVAAMIEGM